LISYFPTPYEDELLYSLIARFHKRTGNYLMCDTLNDLFNNKFFRSSAIIPAKLGTLVKNVEHFNMQFDEILINHTLFPFFMAFSTTKKYDDVYNWAKNSEAGSISLKIGLFGLKGIYDKLRFCPLCYEEEIKKYGESYWHREHQTPGVLVCIKHNKVLMESKINFLKDTKYYYDMCHDNIYPSKAPMLLTEKQEKIAFQVSKDINYLYFNFSEIRKLVINKDICFSDTFLKLLEDKKLVTDKRNLRIDKFKQAFIEYFSNDLLKILGVPLEDDINRIWIVSICRKRTFTNNVIKYVLMCIFLCGSLDKFISELSNFNDIKYTEKTKWNRPDKFEEKLEKYKLSWLDKMNSNPHYCQNDIRKEIPSVYTWLYRHNREWLIKNSPVLKKPGGNKTFENWDLIDDELSLKVKPIVDKIISKKDKPVKVTFSLIEKHLGYKGFLKGVKKTKLPKTMKEINKYVEDTFKYRLRTIKWVKAELKALDIPLSPSTILRRSGINYKDWDKYYLYLEEIDIHNNII